MDQEPEGIIGLPRTISSSVSADHGEAIVAVGIIAGGGQDVGDSPQVIPLQVPSPTSSIVDSSSPAYSSVSPAKMMTLSPRKIPHLSSVLPSFHHFFSFLILSPSIRFLCFFFFFFSFHPLLPPKGGIGRFFYQQSSGQLPMEETKMEDPPPEIPLPVFLPFSFCFPLFSSPCFPLFFTFLFSGSIFFLKRFSLLK